MRYTNNDELWRNLLTGNDPDLRRLNNLMLRLPRGPRCKLCSAPFSGPGSVLVRPFGFKRWAANPSLCSICARSLDKGRGGAEVAATFLFADIRGSTTIAERTSPGAFHALLERFYNAAGLAIDEAGGMVDKYLGDGVVALFVPGITRGREPAAAGIAAGRAVLAATGHAPGEEAWLPIGVGVHSGPAYVGVMGAEGGALDFTGVGDTVNIAARLSSAAADGELIISVVTAEQAGLRDEDAERRRLELKGRDEAVEALVLRASGPLGPAAPAPETPTRS